LKVAVAGASGRMGRMLIDAVEAAPDFSLHSSFDRGDDVAARLAGADVLIDFTRPEATLAHLAVCAELGVKAVVGTTGFEPAQLQELSRLAERTAIVFAPNMSVGVNVVLGLLRQAARALGEGFDVEIVEAHHRHKVDAPSGTALQMGRVVADALGRSLDDCAVYGREGTSSVNGGVRDATTIGFATVRGGDIIGDHTVLFAGTGERIEISHKASSRAIYAQGSLRAAGFLAGCSTGLFGMNDVLGLA
jgi:4-hydroxy-tetrahydrodipicolinate reductase